MILCLGGFAVRYVMFLFRPSTSELDLESWPPMFTGVSSIGLLVVGAFGHL